MNNVEKIIYLLNGQNSLEEQEKGIALARREKDILPFLEPWTREISKENWETCAKVVCDRTNQELVKYLPEMLVWLQDINWPGSLLIQKRLWNIPYNELKPSLDKSISLAIKEEDPSWLMWLSELIKDKDEREKILLKLDQLEKSLNEKGIAGNLKIKNRLSILKDFKQLLLNLDIPNKREESILKLSKFKDPLLLKYFYRYQNDVTEESKLIIKKSIQNILKITADFQNCYNEEFERGFINFLSTINYDKNYYYDKKTKEFNYYKLLWDMNVILNKQENLIAYVLRTLNLLELESLSLTFQFYLNNEDKYIKASAYMGIRNIEIFLNKQSKNENYIN